jgi:hypothetical protein
MRRRGAAAVAALVLAGVVLLAVPGRAGAAPTQDEPDPATTENPVAPEQDIIPRPNSGHDPNDAGDRGGALQITLFVALVGGVGLIVTLVVRESRRNRQSRDAARPTSGHEGSPTSA